MENHSIACPLVTLEDLVAIEEILGDVISQHRAETALYGDSWPGAQVEIREMEVRRAALANRLWVDSPSLYAWVPAVDERDDVHYEPMPF